MKELIMVIDIKKKVLNFITDAEKLVFKMDGVEVLQNGDYQFICEVDLSKLSIDRVIHEILKLTSFKDVTIVDPSMEEIIRTLYA